MFNTAYVLAQLGKLLLGAGLLLYSTGCIVSLIGGGDRSLLPHMLVLLESGSTAQGQEKADGAPTDVSRTQITQFAPGILFWGLVVLVGLVVLSSAFHGVLPEVKVNPLK